MTHALRRTALVGSLALAAAAPAATVQLRDGRVLSGDLGETAGVAEDPTKPGPTAGEVRTTPILVVEDGLRRTYVHKALVREVLDEGAESLVRIAVWQNEAKRGAPLGTIGAPSSVTPFDAYGRRIISLPSNQGEISVVQGITEVTPVYTRVQGLRADPRSYLWDMRLATSSLPRETLTRVLATQTPRGDYDKRMQVVRLYLQAERYRDAAQELVAIREDFAGSAGVEPADLDANLRSLRDLAARELLKEIELRRDAGQHTLARGLLERFPVDGVAGETLQRVRELLEADDAARAGRAETLALLRTTAEGLADAAARDAALRLVSEVERGLGPATADRLAAFRTLADGGTLPAESLAAIALSGWLLGSDRAVESLPSALSLLSLRDRVHEYLAAPEKALRDAALLTIRESDEASVPRVAELLARMAPPLPLPQPEDKSAPAGAHRLRVDVGGRPVEAILQLPPEYDPLRAYPAIVTLGDLNVPVDRQLDFWAGAPAAGVGRVGQAMRRGYVVLSIGWSRADQLRYEYSPEEHAAVLTTLRDAMRRVSIDSDRVFLTGHGTGGDLAWDLALAHPDLWAGVLPFLAVADRYCGWYWENARHTPWRIVLGELDGDKIERNARELDRYLRPSFDATVVEYRGRGYDTLSDDLQLSFDWMGRTRRGAPPEEFECSTMRPWDNYFWWVEARGLPEKSMVAPAEWPRPDARAASIRGRKFAGNKLGVFTAAAGVTVWLTPELVDFDEPVEVELNGRRLTARGERIEPDVTVLLEDARTRAERRRPAWARVDSR